MDGLRLTGRTTQRSQHVQGFAVGVRIGIAAGLFRLSPMFKPGSVDLDLISKEGQKKQDIKDMRDD